MAFIGNVAVSQKAADFIAADGFESIAGHDGLFIRRTAEGTEIVFNTETAGATLVTLQ